MATYGAFALAALAVAALIVIPAIARRPSAVVPGISRDRLVPTLITLGAAFALFILIDVATDHALTSAATIRNVGPFALGVVVAVVLGDVTYLVVRRRRSTR